MTTNIVICLFIGLPASGKSTLVANVKLQYQFSELKVKVLSFSFDEFLSIEDQENIVLETKNTNCGKFKEARSLYAQNIENEIALIKTRSEYEKDDHRYLVILDDNFYYKSMRYRFYQMAVKLKCGFCQVYFKCSDHLAVKRNENRVRKVSHDVIRVMSSRLEPPNQDNFWELQSIFVDSETVNLKLRDICDFMLKNFEHCAITVENNFEEREESRIINMKSILHNCDLELRSLVRNHIKSYTENSHEKILEMKSKYPLEVNLVRQDILARLRNQTLHIPSSVFDTEGEVNMNELNQFLKQEFEVCCKNI